MKISKHQLRKIIKEMTISSQDAEMYLRDRAEAYRRDGLQGRGMKMLLQDDFMDDLGHQHNIEDYEGLIDELVMGESKLKITKRQLRRIIKEERAKLLKEAPAGQYDQAIANMITEGVMEVVYDIVAENDLGRGSIELDEVTVESIAAGLKEAARQWAYNARHATRQSHDRKIR